MVTTASQPQLRDPIKETREFPTVPPSPCFSTLVCRSVVRFQGCRNEPQPPWPVGDQVSNPEDKSDPEPAINTKSNPQKDGKKH